MSWSPSHPPGWLGARRVELETCASTNDEALRLARAGAEHGTVVTAVEQTAGRGRLGRRWASSPGNLMASMVLRPPPGVPLAQIVALPLVVGVAVAEAVRGVGVAAVLKWPNDVGVMTPAGWRKLGGILAESTGGDAPAIVVGVGLNLVAEVPADLAAIATSVGVLVAPPAPAHMLAALLAAFEPRFEAFAAGGLPAIAPAWTALMAPLPRLRAGGVEGTPLGLAADGGLRLRRDDGREHHVIAGDVDVVV